MEYWQFIIALAGLIAAVLVPWLIYRKQSPKREVKVSVLSEKVASAEDVWRVYISIRASGRADVAREAFHGPITVSLGTLIIKDGTTSSAPYRMKMLSDKQVGLEPVLLKASGRPPTYGGVYFCAGKPSISVTQSLENVDITVDTDPLKPTGLQDHHWMWISGLGFALFFLSVITLWITLW